MAMTKVEQELANCREALKAAEAERDKLRRAVEFPEGPNVRGDQDLPLFERLANFASCFDEDFAPEADQGLHDMFRAWSGEAEVLEAERGLFRRCLNRAMIALASVLRGEHVLHRIKAEAERAHEALTQTAKALAATEEADDE